MMKYAFHGLSFFVCPGESNEASFISISQQPREIQKTCPFMRCADELLSNTTIQWSGCSCRLSGRKCNKLSIMGAHLVHYHFLRKIHNPLK